MSNSSPDPQQLFESVIKQQLSNQSALPPVHKWNTPLSGDLDMRIDRDGRWFYLGGEIKRHALVKLFSTILKREGDDYYLITPAEKWRITVDAAPFSASKVEQVNRQAVDALVFTLNDGTEVLLQDAEGFWVDENTDTGEPVPMLRVRDNLNALVHRNVFYHLIDLASEVDGKLLMRSMGHNYSLGDL